MTETRNKGYSSTKINPSMTVWGREALYFYREMIGRRLLFPIVGRYSSPFQQCLQARTSEGYIGLIMPVTIQSGDCVLLEAGNVSFTLIVDSKIKQLIGEAFDKGICENIEIVQFGNSSHGTWHSPTNALVCNVACLCLLVLTLSLMSVEV